MVWRHLVRDEIEQKPESPRGQFRPRGNQAFAASKVFVNHVLTNTKGRAHVIRRAIIGKCLPEIFNKTLVPVRDGDPCRASLPHTHQPDGVDREICDEIPFLRGTVPKVTCLLHV